MKILYVFSQYPAETFAVSEVEALRAHGIDVLPVSLRWGKGRLHKALQSFQLRGDVQIFPFLGFRVWSSLIRFFVTHLMWSSRQLAILIWENRRSVMALVKSLFVFLKSPAVCEYADASKADAVHIFWGHYPSILVPFLKRKNPRRPVTVFLGAYSLMPSALFLQRVLKEADCITTHFEGHVVEIEEKLRVGKPVILCYRGTDLRRRNGSEAPKERTGSVQTIGVVSRLVEEKKVDHALRCFALLATTRSDIRLEVIGWGSEEKRLKKLALDLGVADRIVFTGRLTHPETLRRMADFRIFLLPSLSPFEFYPNAMKEAMTLGVPCVGYGVPGVAAFLSAGTEVRLARAGRIEELARAVADALDDADWRERAIRSAALKVRDFDIEKTSAKQSLLFHSLVRHGRIPNADDLNETAAMAVQIHEDVR